jgi:hypothetical protein
MQDQRTSPKQLQKSKDMLPNTPPSCGVVIFKDDTSENVCPEPAAFVWPFQFMESTEVGMIYLCERHADLFEKGQELIVTDAEGNHLSVQLGDANVTETDGRSDSTGGRDETGIDGAGSAQP